MDITGKQDFISVEEYLAQEERARLKHEYLDGRVFAMSGVTRQHNTIAGNIFSALRSHLKDSPCQAFIAEVKVRVETANSLYYPDVMVACDKGHGSDQYTAEPVLLVEVLSKSTAATDRREKVTAYRQIPTLKEYLIVSQQRKQVELHRRTEDGGWEVYKLIPPTALILHSMPSGQLLLSWEAIYENVDIPDRRDFSVHEEEDEYYPEIEVDDEFAYDY